jgi:hypothetical protein
LSDQPTTTTLRLWAIITWILCLLEIEASDEMGSFPRHVTGYTIMI